MISLIKKTFVYLIIIVQFISFSSSRFACLSQNDQITCHCDEDEKIIDCNSLGLIKFPVINETLKGFVGLTLAHNDIKQNTIPWERDILRKLPDLTVIDFRGVKNLNCDELQRKFERVHVMSSCEYDEETNTVGRRPDDGRSTESSCTTFWCRFKAKFEKTWLKVYAHVDFLWQKVRKGACNLVCKNRNSESNNDNFSAKIRGSNE